MTFSLRLLARSRRLRAMGVLAWLMLVVNSLAAAPMGMTGIPPFHPAHATVAVASEHCHHQAAVAGPRSCCDDQAGCCGDMMGHACNCSAMCSTTLPSAAAVVLTSSTITVRYAMPLPLGAPSLNTAPPLRPPAV
jgi:hypothetical protein